MVAGSGMPEVKVGIGRNPCRPGDTDAVAPEGAAGPSWRASGATLPFSSPRTGGNPWQQRRHRRVPSWSCCLVPAFQSLGAWWEVSGGRSGREGSPLLLIRRCRHLFLLYFLFRFFWTWLCCFRPSTYRWLYPVVCYIYIAGRKPVSRINVLDASEISCEATFVRAREHLTNKETFSR